jgi:rubrerythrin
MILQKMKCPYGCESPVFTESVKALETTPSNLLLEGNKPPVTEHVRVYTCNCCGNTFETKENSDGRIVL